MRSVQQAYSFISQCGYGSIAIKALHLPSTADYIPTTRPQSRHSKVLPGSRSFFFGSGSSTPGNKFLKCLCLLFFKAAKILAGSVTYLEVNVTHQVGMFLFTTSLTTSIEAS